MQTRLLIDGELVVGGGAALSVINPATGAARTMTGLAAGCDMSVYALDAYTAIRHVMVAH